MLRVMLVDDDRIVLEGMKQAIDWRMHDCVVTALATDGEAALAAIASASPDVVLCDIVMPRMDGLKLLAAAKEQYPRVLFVMISAHDESAYVRQAIREGAVDYLIKPVSNAEISRVLATVRTHLANDLSLQTQNALERPNLLIEASAHINAVQASLEGFESGRAGAEVRALFDYLRSHKLDSRLLLTTLCMNLLVSVLKAVLTTMPELAAEERVALERRFRLDLSKYADINAIEYAVLALVNNAGSLILQERMSSSRIAQRAAAIIKRDCNQNLTVPILATKLHVSSNHLQNLFKKKFNCTIHQFIIKERIELAKHLLRSTNERIYTVGVKAGYQDVDFFAQTFYKATGMTPNQYREAGQ